MAPMHVDRRWAAFGVLAVAALLRFYDLGQHSLWLDEVTTTQEIATWKRAAASGFHPPLYFLLLKVWSSILGSTPAALRAFSALFGTASVWLAYRLARDVFEREDVAMIAAALVAVAPHALWYSREIRMYAPWTFFALLMLVGAMHLGRQQGWSIAVLAYLGGAVAGQLTHHYHLFYVAGAAVAAAIVLRDDRGRWLRVHAVLAGGAVLAAGTFALVRGQGPAELARYALGRVTAGGTGPTWSTLSQLVLFENWAYRMGSDHRATGLVLAGVTTAAVFVAARGGRRRLAFSIATVLPLLAIVFLPIRSYARLFAPTVPALCVLYAFAMAWPIVRFGRRGWIATVPSLLIVAWIGRPFVTDVYDKEIEAWGSVCERIAAADRGRDVVLVTARYVTKAVDYHCEGPTPIRGFPTDEQPLTAEAVLALAEGYDHVWMIYSHAFDPKDADVRRDAVAVLQTRLKLLGAWRVGPLIEVYELER